jgi:glutamate decarboxylase
MGHMTGVVPGFISILSEVVTRLNQNLVKCDASRIFTALERRALRTLHRFVFREPDAFYEFHATEQETTLGMLSAGGTLANLTALWIARNACFRPTAGFPGIDEAGLGAALDHYGHASAVIVASELAHYSIAKAAAILGLGTKGVISIPVDAGNRMDVGALEDCLEECGAGRKRVLAVVANAGSTDCGSIDPIAQIVPLARAAQAFLHVDAAWGGPLLFSRSERSRLRGIELADSVAFDAHKQMYLPVASSVLLLRNPGVARLIERRSPYMLQEGSGDLGSRSLEGSRGANVLYLDAALAIIGASGYEFLIEENLRKARLMAETVRRFPQFELLFEPELNVVLYRYLPEEFRAREISGEDNARLNEVNESLQKEQAAAGRTYVSRTTVENTAHGRRTPVVALRAVIANPLVEQSHMRLVLEDQIGIAAGLANPRWASHAGVGAV